MALQVILKELLMYQKIMFLFALSIFLLSAGRQAQSEEIVWTKRTLNDLGIKGDEMNAIFLEFKK